MSDGDDGEGDTAGLFTELDPKKPEDLQILTVYLAWIIGTVVLLITVFIVRSRLARLRTSLNRFGKLASTKVLFENLQRARGGPGWMQQVVAEEVEHSLVITKLMQEQRKKEWEARGKGPTLADGTHTGRPALPQVGWANGGRAAQPTRDGPTTRPGASRTGFRKLRKRTLPKGDASDIRRGGGSLPPQIPPHVPSNMSFSSSRYESTTERQDPSTPGPESPGYAARYQTADTSGDGDTSRIASFNDFTEPGGSPLAKQAVGGILHLQRTAIADAAAAASPSGGFSVELEPDARSPVETDSFI